MRRYIIHTFAIAAAALAVLACNKSETITKYPPRIKLDNPAGIYQVKAGRELTIAPTVTNGEGAQYLWTIDGVTVSREPQLVRTYDRPGEVYVDFRVVNGDGSDSVELRVDVLDLELPQISLPLPDEGLTALAGREYILRPTVSNAEGACYLWTLDGAHAGTDSFYAFRAESPGRHTLTLAVTNQDGTARQSYAITVVESIPVTIEFDAPCRGADPLRRSVASDRRLWLRPRVSNAENPHYAWSVDGVEAAGAEGPEFVFTPPHKGTFKVTVRVTDGVAPAAEGGVTEGARYAEATVTVEAGDGELARLRPATAGSSPLWNKVYEYLPAPGQFINEPLTGGFSGQSTFEAAAEYAAQRMRDGAWVSLGAFGGYIIVGFDHSIENRGSYQGYDFSVTGNQFDGNSEPGIIWVMQDTNGNGLPDDEWYRLRGSEWGKPETVDDYAVTYYRPAAPGMDVAWTDNLGDSGAVYYMKAFHQQESYYPLWMM